MPPGPGVSGSHEAPAAVRAEFREVPTLPHGVVLAHRTLQRKSEELLLDTGKRRALALEIEPVLSRIRDAHPVTADVTVRPSHALGRLILGLEPDLSEIPSGLLDDATGPAALRTRRAEFDAHDARLGLSAATLFPALRTAAFGVDEHANIGAAVEAYAAMDGIDYVEPDILLGDGPDNR